MAQFSFLLRRRISFKSMSTWAFENLEARAQEGCPSLVEFNYSSLTLVGRQKINWIVERIHFCFHARVSSCVFVCNLMCFLSCLACLEFSLQRLLRSTSALRQSPLISRVLKLGAQSFKRNLCSSCIIRPADVFFRGLWARLGVEKKVVSWEDRRRRLLQLGLAVSSYDQLTEDLLAWVMCDLDSSN